MNRLGMSCIPTNPQKEILARGGIKSRLRHYAQNACQSQFFLNGPAKTPTLKLPLPPVKTTCHKGIQPGL